MNSAIVTIASDLTGSIVQVSGDESVQVVRCLVNSANEQPTEQISIWSSGKSISPEARKALVQKLQVSNPRAMMSSIEKDSECRSSVSTEAEPHGSPFAVAAGIAVIKASWGWAECELIVVQINGTEIKVEARYDGANWIASGRV